MDRAKPQTAVAVMTTALVVTVAACGGGSGNGDGNRSGMTGSTTTVSLTSIVTAPTSVSGCGTTQVTATLSGPAPSGGVGVALSASPNVLAPASITIAAGASSGSTTVAQSITTPATAPATVAITGSTTAASGVAASSQVGMLSLAAPIAAFTVSGTARGADACQITNASGQFDCTFNGSTSSGASRWTWSWTVGPASGGPQDTTTPTFQPTTACGLFTGATVMGSPGNTFVQMVVNLTVRDVGNTQSCGRQNGNVRVFSGGFCGGF